MPVLSKPDGGGQTSVAPKACVSFLMARNKDAGSIPAVSSICIRPAWENTYSRNSSIRRGQEPSDTLGYKRTGESCGTCQHGE